MPRFFFHVRGKDQRLSRDELGLNLPNVETARNEVVRAAQDLEGVFAARGEDPRDYAIQVETALGELVGYLPFSAIFDGQAEAVAFCDDPRPPQGRQDGSARRCS